MIRKPVQSSTIEEIGYDSATHTLEIKFRSARVYQFFNVPYAKFVALAADKSPGGYFLAHINQQYKYEHLNPTPQEAERAQKRKKTPTKAETAKVLGIKNA